MCWQVRHILICAAGLNYLHIAGNYRRWWLCNYFIDSLAYTPHFQGFLAYEFNLTTFEQMQGMVLVFDYHDIDAILIYILFIDTLK